MRNCWITAFLLWTFVTVSLAQAQSSGRLSDDIVADFAKWIDMGAPDPRLGNAPTKPKREINIDEGRKWWSFQPLQVVVPPQVSDPTATLQTWERHRQAHEPLIAALKKLTYRFNGRDYRLTDVAGNVIPDILV